jgi:tetratricopeptide (TPR) repeat protein
MPQRHLELDQAIHYHKHGNLSKAKEIYLRILENDQGDAEVLNYLGCLLKAEGHVLQGRSFLRKSLAANPNQAIVWYNLGNSLLITSDLRDAAYAYKRSIALDGSGIPELWSNYGKCLQELGFTEEAIRCYRRELVLYPDNPRVLLTLGNRLSEKRLYTEAIDCYKKTIEILPDYADAHKALAIVSNQCGLFHNAVASYRKYYELRPAVAVVDIRRDAAETGVQSKMDYQLAVPESARLIPSYSSSSIPYGMNLSFIHIPKTGGIRFSSPLTACLQTLLQPFDSIKSSDYLRWQSSPKPVSIFASNTIDDDALRDGMLGSIGSLEIDRLDISFTISHGVSSRELHAFLRQRFNVSPIRIATWRHPQERLLSALQYLWRTSDRDFDLIEKMVKQKDPFLYNSIYRGYFSSFDQNMAAVVSPDVDFLIDISNFSVLDQIASLFISRCRLPNIIVNNVVNSTPQGRDLHDAEAIRLLMDRCTSEGFMALDNSPDIRSIVRTSLPNELSLNVDTSGLSLHPLTLVFFAVTGRVTTLRSAIVRTEYLSTSQGADFLRNIYAS